MKIKAGSTYRVKDCGIEGVEEGTRGYLCVAETEPQVDEGWFEVWMLGGPDTGMTFFATADELEEVE